MISIIIPCYNCEKTIVRTLKSLEKQSYKDFEIIAINDGSKDKTLDVLEEYAYNTKIKFKIINQINLGVSSARNKGIEKSNGEFITFLDADDLYHKDFLRYMYNAICSKKADMAACSFDYIDNKCYEYDSMSSNERQVLTKYDFFDMYKQKRKYKLNLWSCIYITKIIKENRITFSQDLKYGEDSEFLCKYLFHCQKGVIYLRSSLYGYTIAQSSAMHTINYNRIQTIEAYQRINKYWEKDLLFNKEIGRYMIDRAVWAVAKDFAINDQRLYRRFINDYNVNKSMRNLLSQADELSVKISSAFFLINKNFFRIMLLFFDYLKGKV